MKRFYILCAIALFLGGCSSFSADNPVDESSTDTEASDAFDTSEFDVLDASAMFTDDDKDAAYDAASATRIDLSTVTDTSSVNVSSDAIEIVEAGTYILTGSTSKTVKVNVSDTEKVQLVLDNVSITTQSFAALYIYQADEVKITLADGSMNTLSNTDGFTADGDVNVDAVIFSRDDLILNGSGTVSITSVNGNGITGKDDLKLYGTSITVSATGHGLEANDSVRIGASKAVIDAGSDVIQAENTEDAARGYVYVEASDLMLSSGNDGIQASSVLQIMSGTIEIATHGGADSTNNLGDESAKGLKAAGIVYLADGTFDLDTLDDAIHSNMDVIIDKGTYTIKSSDDGIHADKTVLINQPVLTILKSYEGIEGLTVEINGGTLSINAADDGINASDGSGSQMPPGQTGTSNSEISISIQGGHTSIIAGGDGVDSNGDLVIAGGEIYISAPSQGNGALDTDGAASIEGGVVVATGDSGMAMNFTTATQGSVLYNVGSTLQSGTAILVKDSSGNALIDTVALGDYSSIVVSHPSIKQGDTITIVLDGQETSVTLDSWVTTIGTGGDFRGGNRR